MLKKLLFLLVPTFFYAQIPAYYSSIDFSQEGDYLKKAIKDIFATTAIIQFVVGVYSFNYFLELLPKTLPGSGKLAPAALLI